MTLAEIQERDVTDDNLKHHKMKVSELGRWKLIRSSLGLVRGMVFATASHLSMESMEEDKRLADPK